MQSGNGSWALGWDASQFNGGLNWATANQRLSQFAILRATDGLAIRDTMLTANAEAAKQHGVAHGFYLVADPGGVDATDTPALQQNGNSHAGAFLAALDSLGGYQGWMLPPFIDCEGAPPGWTPEQAVAWLTQIGGSLDAAIKDPRQTAGLYADINTLRWLASAPNVGALAHRPLWVAWWTTVTPPPTVGPWSTWTCWQLTNHKQIPIAPHPVDWDEWAAPVAALPKPPVPVAVTVPDWQQPVAALQLTVQAHGVALSQVDGALRALQQSVVDLSQRAVAAGKALEGSH